MKKFISMVLTLSMVFSLTAPALAAGAGGGEAVVYTLSNENIRVDVSAENGGFAIRTVEGNQLKKSDNNKKLLYHSGAYDTSFTSFEVERGGNTKQYIFGGQYGFLGLNSSDVTVQKNQESIVSEWTVDGITFKQTIELPNQQSLQHGMVAITYTADVVSGGDAKIRTRMLFDTALGEQDYGYYTVNDSAGYAIGHEQETEILPYDQNQYIPETIYASDQSGLSGSIAAYTINQTATRAVFGHWNNLASTVFDYTPDPSMTFTNAQNVKYATADSACALYNDMGNIAEGQKGSVACYYGVYSNYNVNAENSVALNIVAPNALTLTSDKKAYETVDGFKGGATFPVSISMENASELEFSNVAIAAYASNGITPLTMDGAPYASVPYQVNYPNFKPGDVQNFTFQFAAAVSSSATYRRIEIRVHDISKEVQLSEGNLIGIKSFYVLCPGGDGKLPQVTFTGADPKILYYTGGNRYTITGTNFGMLRNTEKYDVAIVSDDGDPNHKYDVAHEDIVIDDEAGTMTLLLSDTYDPGAYHVYINWKESAHQDNIVPQDTPLSYTSEALQLIFSEDPIYRNNIYGIAAVVQLAGTMNYEIMSFKDEAELTKYKAAHSGDEFLLELRGRFETQTDGQKPAHVVRMTGTAQGGAEGAITINQCLDFQDGIVEVYLKDEAYRPGSNVINVDFDGSLYTAGERTHIASVPAAFTSIEDGKDFGLLTYDMDGQRDEKPNENYITLIWSNDGLQMLQKIAGSVFHLCFGIMGQFENEQHEIIGKTVSFTGGFDMMGILLPKGYKFKEGEHGGALDRIKGAFSSYNPRKSSAEYLSQNSLRDRADSLFGPDNDLTADELATNEKSKPDVQILVQDVLFASVSGSHMKDGKDFCGFYGFSVDTNIVLPQYTTSMPQIFAHVYINTIRNYNFTVEGSLTFSTLQVEVSLDVKSQDNVPILNKIFFAFNIPGGAVGIPLDPAGTVKITGGGGGLDNIYETVICSDKLPTIQILLRIYLNAISVLTCQGDAMLSLQGVEISMSNLRLSSLPANVPPIIPYAGLKLQWLPEWYFHLAVTADLFQVVTGGGYIVVDQRADDSVFFEGFLRALIRIPDYVGLVGGVNIGGASLGLNSEKVWGCVEAIGIPVGIIYYWGDANSFDFGANVGDADPTYPNLIPNLTGFEPVLLGYDTEAGKNVYMCIGTNLSIAASAAIVEELETAPVLMSGPSIQSTPDRRTHQVTTDSGDEVITLVYAAASFEEAKTLYGQMQGLPDNVILYSEATQDSANANLTYNPETGKATLAITHKSGVGQYRITTPVSTEISLLSVAPVPQVTTIDSAAAAGENQIEIAYSGTELGALDEISFYLSEKQNVTDNQFSSEADIARAGGKLQPVESDAGMLLGTLTERAALESGSVTFDLPDGLPSGAYYVRAVYAQDNIVSDYAVTNQPIFRYTNSEQPAKPILAGCENAGDYYLAATLSGAIPADVSGYLVTVYDSTGKPTEFADTDISKDTIENGRLLVGGSFTAPVYDADSQVIEGKERTISLRAGESYTVGISAYADKTNAAGTAYRLIGPEMRSTPVRLTAPTPAKITITSDKGTMLRTDNLTLTVRSDEAITGTWKIVNAPEDPQHPDQYHGSFTAQKALTLPFTDLPDNSYTFELFGHDASGDAVSETFTFAVDTVAPRLVLSSPINGTTFKEDGTLTISGISELDALITVEQDGAALDGYTRKELRTLDTSLDENGCFSFTVPLDAGTSTQQVTVIAEDSAGNRSTHSAKVNHQGLGHVKKLDIALDGVTYSNHNINTKDQDVTGKLSLVATTTADNRFIINDPTLIYWDAQAVEGTASVDAAGNARIARGSEGFITGMFSVTSVAPMTAAATFGTLTNALKNTVVIGSSVGGSVTGGGDYVPGQQVVLTAVPQSGYRFDGWTVEGAAPADLTSETIRFTMPDGTVTATARFVSLSGGRPSAEKEPSEATVLATVNAKSDERVVYPLPPETQHPEDVIVRYSKDGGKTYQVVAKSDVQNGKVVFIAPIAGDYQIVEHRRETFIDNTAAWSKDYIDFVAARGIVNGVGNNRFAPHDRLTRSMFVTMLGRIEGELGRYDHSAFVDTKRGSWYDEFADWAAYNGIVRGYDPQHFAPDDAISREQICVMLFRYLQLLDSDTGKIDALRFTDQSAISPWAKEAVATMQSLGIITGYNTGEFRPQGGATRAETAAILTRFIQFLLR